MLISFASYHAVSALLFQIGKLNLQSDEEEVHSTYERSLQKIYICTRETQDPLNRTLTGGSGPIPEKRVLRETLDSDDYGVQVQLSESDMGLTTATTWAFA